MENTEKQATNRLLERMYQTRRYLKEYASRAELEQLKDVLEATQRGRESLE